MTLDPTKIPVPVEGDWLGVRRALQVIRQFFGEVAEDTGDTTDFAKLASALNIFMQSQTVRPNMLSSASGVVDWDLNLSQNAELVTTENIDAVNVSNGYSGRFLSLRITSGGAHSITWGDSFKNMDTFVMPSPGNVTVVSFRCRSTGLVEFIGQSSEFNEWEFEDKISVTLRELAANGTGAITRKATSSVTLPAAFASGLLVPLPPGSGYITLTHLLASMTGSIGRNATSFVTLQPMSVSATGRVNTRGTSTAALGALSTSGAGKYRRKATEATILTKMLTSGAGKMARKSTSSAALHALAGSGSGTVSTFYHLLLESGDKLLLESGDKLHLES